MKTPVQEIMVLRDFINNLSFNRALISDDDNNELTVGSDNKLSLETDKLKTHFNYASSVSTFWSI